jgi:hypothetical protein
MCGAVKSLARGDIRNGNSLTVSQRDRLKFPDKLLAGM